MVSSIEHPDLENLTAESLTTVIVERLTSAGPLLRQVANWLTIIEVCVDLDRKLTHETEDRRLQFHRAMTGFAVGMGEYLLWRARTQNLELAPIGTDLPTIEASLQLAWDIFSTWHSGMEKRQRDKIVEEVFGVEARTA